MTEKEQIAALRLIIKARDSIWYIGNGTTDEELQDIADRLDTFFHALSAETRMLVTE